MRTNDGWEEAKNLVKERADLVEIVREHVDLKRSGFRYLGSCPFHQEKTPSFTVHPDQQFYHCFGCKASGDVFSFMMEYHQMDFREALKHLAQRYQVELPEKKRSAAEIEQERRRQQMFGLNSKATDFYHDYLLNHQDAAGARAYLAGRGIPLQTQKGYLLGYAPAVERAGWNFLGSRLSEDERSLAIEIGLLVSKERNRNYDRFRDRILFPIYDSRGRVCGFGGRIVGEGEPKYLNSPESPIYNKSRMLFGLYQQRESIRRRRRAVLVEGNFDLLALVAKGVDLAVAPLGTALTREQLRLLKPLVDDVVLLFDGDEAGLKAAERSVPLFLAEQMSGRVALLPEGHDPDTYINEFGAAGLTKALDAAGPLPEFVLQQFIDRHGLTLDGKFRIIEELRPLVGAAASPVQRDTMVRHFGAVLGIDTDRLAAELVPGNEARPGPPVEAQHPPKTSRQSGLDGALRSIVGFMVKNPNHFERLLDYGIDAVLAGTAGEMICLQLKSLVREKKATTLDPEELFSELPPGEERALVASILTEVSLDDDAQDNGPDTMLEDVLQWLNRQNLKLRSEELMRRIREAEEEQNGTLLKELLQEKMKVDGDLKNG
ncbi:MAG: DNA primase [Desulfofustis sp.]|nr:DNA primase [Desulfofustis sp.]